MLTPLRYPGGKAKLGAWLAHLLRNNNIQDGSYIEAYAGGAGAAIYLLSNKYVKNIFINDIDPAIYSFWNSVTNDSRSFIKLLLETEVTIDEREKQREIYFNPLKHTELELGFATFFLNRTNRSGIIKGGVIGGKNQDGNYKIDARYTKENLAKRILDISEMRSNITISSDDAIKFMNKVPHNANSLINLDPPYYKKADQLYSSFYTHDDHVRIAQLVHSIKTPIIVTYDNCEEIQEIYEDHNTLTFNIIYSSHLERPIAKELLIYKNINIDPLPFTSKQISPIKEPSTKQLSPSS
ncbi:MULTISPECIES: DNA adenine methylase [Pseudomonas]|uniref:DNA adenine methylase n=1 Tax=Pseudomonas umsongensis TaxID=198618 RepID=A0ACC5MEF2_9PSED|nr:MULTISPECIES: DNA adenine methylase [Pseudomonas]MBB2886994.1 DNA adenine methylase [Pseudomonas umsongensis]NMN78444.1 DNA adenine methylase [Pseudomonas sp. KD5]